VITAVASASVATTVVTAVVFSATLIEADAPPPFDVMTGVASLTSVTVTVNVVFGSAGVTPETETTKVKLEVTSRLTALEPA
jgi:hypothetical protein